MKLLNKKSIGGFEWILLLIGIIIAFGVVMYGTMPISLPNAGERSLAVSASLEEGLNVPLSVEKIMSQLNTESLSTYENHKVFRLDSYCKDIHDADNDGITDENTNYKEKILAANLGFKTPKPGQTNYFTAREEVKCYAAESELMNYYEESFTEEYGDFKSKKWENLNLDFSSTDYSPELVAETKDGKKEYFNLLTTDNGFIIPIAMNGKNGIKNIGTFNVKPNFKLKTPNSISKPFDSYELCIFSSDCGATCHDAMEKNPSSNYRLLDNNALKCDAYFDCKTPLDQFGKEYLCDSGKILCEGQCLPFCSVSSGRVSDGDFSTSCNEFSCSSYLDCGSAGDVCGCPDPANAAFSSACTGNDCSTKHCSRDNDYENKYLTPPKKTICLPIEKSCSDFGDCVATNVCSCDSENLNSCLGECYCHPGNWVDTGGCGEYNEEGVKCNWNEKPQKKEYTPITCSDTAYRCDPRQIDECQCVPDVPCSGLDCGKTDSCNNYCGDCQEEGPCCSDCPDNAPECLAICNTNC